MSLKLSKSPFGATIVIVGLIAATALVAGYIDRPGNDSEVAAADDKCASCPRAGTEECCKVTGVCAEGGCTGAEGATCSSAGDCSSKMAPCAAGAEKPCSSAQATCSKEAPASESCPKAPAAAAQAGCCAAGGCTGAK